MKLNVIAFVAAVILGGCSKDKATEDKEPAATGAGAVAVAVPEAKGPKVFEYPTAQAFDDDYRSVKGMEFMDKFGMDGRFRIAGTVGKVVTEEAGNASVWFMLDGNKRVSLAFADDGKAVAEKGLKEGDAIKVLCDAGGADDNLIMLLRCELE